MGDLADWIHSIGIQPVQFTSSQKEAKRTIRS